MNWQYITGFFDADGSITIAVISKGRKRAPQLSFHNNELDILISIQTFIKKELNIIGHICSKKKAKEHHGQQYDLKYVNFPKCIEIIKHIKSIHPKKAKRFKVINELYPLTPRNGKYTEEMSKQRRILEEEFFK
jgi:hypothetical protein